MSLLRHYADDCNIFFFFLKRWKTLISFGAVGNVCDLSLSDRIKEFLMHFLYIVN